MSEYHQVEVNLEDFDCIIGSLKEMGYNPICNDVADNLKGYQNDVREQKAHIIIPKSQVGSASNDIGFEKVDKKYILHISQYDQSAKTFDVGKLKKTYAVQKLNKFIKKSTRYKISSKQELDGGKIKIRLKKKF